MLEAAAWMLWALVTPAIMRLTQRLPPRAPHLLPRLLAHATAAAAILVAQLAAYAFLEPWARPESVGSFGERFGSMLSPPAALSVLVIYSVVMAVAGGLGMRRDVRDAHDRARELERERSSLAQLLAESRLEALQRQLQPHFLFNTLHSISALMEHDISGARRMMSRLADLLRAALAAPSAIPLEEELGLLESFLEIERIRLGDSLLVTYDVAATARAVRVPSMVLQPLVENAIRHGVPRSVAAHDSPPERNQTPGSIRITATMTADRLRLTVADRGEGVAANADRRHGVGVTNTQSRLAALYGPAAANMQV